MLGAFFAAAVAVYQNLLRRIYESSGKVRTAEFDIPDLMITTVLSGFFSLLMFLSFARPEPAAVSRLEPDKVLFNSIFFLVIVLGIGALVHCRGVSLKHLFGFDRLRVGRALVVALGLILAAVPLMLAAAVLAQPFLRETAGEQELVTLFRNMASKADFLTLGKMVLSITILAPIAEEFLFRGYFYGTLKRYCGAVPSAVFMAALFAGIHMNLSSLPSLFVLALCLTIAYEATGCLLVPIVMHALFNMSQLVILYWQSNGS